MKFLPFVDNMEGTVSQIFDIDLIFYNDNKTGNFFFVQILSFIYTLSEALCAPPSNGSFMQDLLRENTNL